MYQFILLVFLLGLGIVAGTHLAWWVEVLFAGFVWWWLEYGPANGEGLKAIPAVGIGYSMVFVCIGILLGDISWYFQTTDANWNISFSDLFIVKE